MSLNSFLMFDGGLFTFQFRSECPSPLPLAGRKLDAGSGGGVVDVTRRTRKLTP